MQITRCPSCDGYAWMEDDDGQAMDCDWCAGVGYVYRDPNQVDHHIPEADYGVVADQLERLETERLREIGYTGQAKKPWQQAARGQGDEPAE
jgi:hypothetical protein